MPHLIYDAILLSNIRIVLVLVSLQLERLSFTKSENESGREDVVGI